MTENVPADKIIKRTGEAKEVFANHFLSISTTPVEFASGTSGEYSVVTKGSGMGAVVIPHLSWRGQNYYGLVELYRFPFDAMCFEFPRGETSNLEEDEALREVIEETGLDAKTLRRRGVIRPDSGLLSTEVGVWTASFSGKDLSPLVAPSQVEGDEINSFRWASVGEFRRYVNAGRIKCAMTLAAFTFLP